MTSKRPLQAEDIALFRRLAGEVKPLAHKTADIIVTQNRQQKGRQRANISVSTNALEKTGFPVQVQTGNEILFKRPGIQNRVFRKLRRGQIRIVAELDLHGMKLAKAKVALDRFLNDNRFAGGQACVRVIHGKGSGSRNGIAVLKLGIQEWLQCNKNVLAYCSCLPSDGGTGAVYVLFKNG